MENEVSLIMEYLIAKTFELVKDICPPNFRISTIFKGLNFIPNPKKSMRIKN
jgi:hypothetical protein